jgi:hypothetical protein
MNPSPKDRIETPSRLVSTPEPKSPNCFTSLPGFGSQCNSSNDNPLLTTDGLRPLAFGAVKSPRKVPSRLSTPEKVQRVLKGDQSPRGMNLEDSTEQIKSRVLPASKNGVEIFSPCFADALCSRVSQNLARGSEMPMRPGNPWHVKTSHLAPLNVTPNNVILEKPDTIMSHMLLENVTSIESRQQPSRQTVNRRLLQNHDQGTSTPNASERGSVGPVIRTAAPSANRSRELGQEQAQFPSPKQSGERQ